MQLKMCAGVGSLLVVLIALGCSPPEAPEATEVSWTIRLERNAYSAWKLDGDTVPKPEWEWPLDTHPCPDGSFFSVAGSFYPGERLRMFPDSGYKYRVTSSHRQCDGIGGSSSERSAGSYSAIGDSIVRLEGAPDMEIVETDSNPSLREFIPVLLRRPFRYTKDGERISVPLLLKKCGGLERDDILICS